MNDTPAPRLRVPLPAGRLPRAGKIRLGEQTTNANGTLYPRALGHFTAREDESGITSAAAAAAFHAIYGDAPTEIQVVLVGETPDDNLEGAHRLYGTGGKLKRRCDGDTCATRTATGWQQAPCACAAMPPTVTKRGREVRNPELCALTYSLQVLLPDVDGIGVWQIDTGSRISVEKIAGALRLFAQIYGSLSGLAATLRLVPVTVAPEGVAKTVHVLDLAIADASPRAALGGAARRELGAAPRLELPAPHDDDRDPLTHPTPDEIDAAAGLPAAVEEARASAKPRASESAARSPISAAEARARLAWMADLAPDYLSNLRERCSAVGVIPTHRGLAIAFGDAIDSAALLETALGDREAAAAAVTPEQRAEREQEISDGAARFRADVVGAEVVA